MPIFHNLIQVEIPFSFLLTPQFISIALAVLVLSGLIAGSYPALLLSRFIPAEVIKGKFTSGQGGSNLRWVFIVFQFVVSVGLIACSLIIQQQLDFIRNRDLGLNKEQVLIIPISSSMGKKYLSFKEDLKNQTGIKKVAASKAVPFHPDGTMITFVQNKDGQPVNLSMNNIDEDFLSLYEIQWTDHLPDAENFGKLNGKVIINEAAARELNLKEPIGASISIGSEKLQVAGVVKDFNFMSLQWKIRPMMMTPIKDTSGVMAANNAFLSVRMEPTADLPSKIAQIENMYRQYEPAKPFEYFFLDETIDKLYKYEDRLSNIFQSFTLLAIVIACLGLFGLATFTADRRIKEIGIRKVFGATVASIVTLLTKDFLRPVLLAMVLAFPISWYFMSKWLEKFEYRIALNWWMFAFAGITAIVIAILTVSIQTMRTARMNPAKTLRSD